MNKAKSKGLLIILSGPSGVGKGTLRQEIINDKSLNLFYSVSMTTRAKRPGETEGIDYYYVSKEEFQRNIDNGNLLEWAEFVGNRYGTPKDRIDAQLALGKNVLLEIETKGAQQVLDKCAGPNLVSIFVIPPSLDELEARIRGRGTESDEVIKERIEKARVEMHKQKLYQYKVVNDDLKRAANEIASIIHSKMEE
ncbi:MAG: guanylate kinase [Bacilli bacterium]|nr:guanylate kinase [Bacilli bacterium]